MLIYGVEDAFVECETLELTYGELDLFNDRFFCPCCCKIVENSDKKFLRAYKLLRENSKSKS